MSNHPTEPNTTQIKLHHSRHPSDNLCGVELLEYWGEKRREKNRLGEEGRKEERY